MTSGNKMSREYVAWRNMKTRCLNPHSPAFQNYGGRGIKICDRWMTFEHFLSDMGPCPDGLEIERIKNEKGYEPGNCYWGTILDQANNKRSNLFLEFRGETKTAAQWSRELGIKPSLIYCRIEDGWSDEKTLTTPARHLTRRFP